MADMTPHDYLLCALATASCHEITVDEVLTMAAQCSTAEQLDAMIDAYSDHVPVLEVFIEAEPIEGERQDWVGFLQYAADMQVQK